MDVREPAGNLENASNSTGLLENPSSGKTELGRVSPVPPSTDACEAVSDGDIGDSTGILRTIKIEPGVRVKTEPGVTVKIEPGDCATRTKPTSFSAVKFRIRLGSDATTRGIKREREEDTDVTQSTLEDTDVTQSKLASPQNKPSSPGVQSSPASTGYNREKISCSVMDKEAIEALLISGCPRVKLVRWNLWDTTGQAKSPGQSPVAGQSPRQSPATRKTISGRARTSNLSTDNIENLIKTGSPSVKLVNPMSYKNRSQLWAGFLRVEFDGKLEYFASCRRCNTIFPIDQKRSTDGLRKHLRKCVMSQNTPGSTRKAPPDDKNVDNDTALAEFSSDVQHAASPLPTNQNSTQTRFSHMSGTTSMPYSPSMPPTSPLDHTAKSTSVINGHLSPDISSNHCNDRTLDSSPGLHHSPNSSFDQMRPLVSPKAVVETVKNDCPCPMISDAEQAGSSTSTPPCDSTNETATTNRSSDNNTSVNLSTTETSLSTRQPGSESTSSTNLQGVNDKEKISRQNDESGICDPTAPATTTPTGLPLEQDHPTTLTSDPDLKSRDVKDAEEIRRQVLDAAVAMCVKDLKPLSTCHGAGFKHFVHEMLKIVYSNCTLDTSSFVPDITTATSHLNLTYTKVKDKVKQDLCGCGQVAMCAELRDNCLTLSARYISDTWRVTSRVLSTRCVEDETQLIAALNDTLQDFGLESSVCVWATQSSTAESRCPDTVRALTTVKQLPCAVQSLNTVVGQVLYPVQSEKSDPATALYPATTSQRDDVIGVIKAWEGLAHHCQAAGLKLALAEEYPREWKSRLARLESFGENWKAMRVFLQDRDEIFLRQENVDKHVLDDVTTLLQAFRRVTELLSKEDAPTLHLVLPCKIWLLQQCKQGLFDCAVIAKLKEDLRRGVETNLVIDPLHEVASSLHPGKKFLRYITKSEERLDISIRVKDALGQLLTCDVKNDTAPPTKRRKVDSQGMLDVFWSESDLSTEDDHMDFESEVSDDVMNYWLTNGAKWPKLAAVARRVLAIPASAQPPSQWFGKRTLLEPEALHQIVFLNYNMGR